MDTRIGAHVLIRRALRVLTLGDGRVARVGTERRLGQLVVALYRGMAPQQEARLVIVRLNVARFQRGNVIHTRLLVLNLRSDGGAATARCRTCAVLDCSVVGRELGAAGALQLRLARVDQLLTHAPRERRRLAWACRPRSALARGALELDDLLLDTYKASAWLG